MQRKIAAKGLASVVTSVVVILLLSMPLGILAPIGNLANPGGGVWAVAGQAAFPAKVDLALPELDGTVTVYRDTDGVPHIFATTEHDLFLAQGFVTAQDRMWQMDVYRRAAEGRLAEVFGAKVGDLDVLATDTFVRTIGLPHIAQAMWASATPGNGEKEELEAFAAGVNAFLRYVGSVDLPLEFKLLGYAPDPWTPVDSAAWGAFMSWTLSGSFADAEIALLRDGLGQAAVDELFPYRQPYQRPVDPRYPSTRGDETAADPAEMTALRDVLRQANALAALTGGGPMLGSNNWVVNGSRTDTGRPRLANDPHLAFSTPMLWYEVHLVAPGYDVVGVAFPPAPGVILGQNRRIAWGATNVGADVVDLYEETVSGDRYLYAGEWKDLDLRPETIHVRGQADVTVTVRSTIHGPLVTTQGRAYAMRWTAQDARTQLGAFLAIDRAGNYTEFRDALRLFHAPAQNFAFASVDGTIAMRSNGDYPVREGFDGRYPLNGSSGAYEWNGTIPFDEEPESVDPVEGYALSSNEQPQADTYPWYMGWSWDPGYRARRIDEMLAADASVTAEDLRQMQLDTVDVFARETWPFLHTAVAGTCPVGPCAAALAAMEAWNASAARFRMDAELAAPAVWWRFANAFRDGMFGDEWARGNVTGLMLPNPNLIEHLLKTDPASAWFDDVRTPAVETWADIARRAFGDAVDGLAAELGADVSTWTWGAVHVREWPHFTGLAVLGRGPVPSPGDSLTVDAAAGETVTAGPSWRLLADLNDLNASRGVYPGGQSGNPLSRHYDDLLEKWLAGDYQTFVLPAKSADMPAASVESTLVLRRA